MKQRILTGWTLTRALYALMGAFIVIQSTIQGQWIGVILGGYFASMGIFAFGCAAGHCLGSTCNTARGKEPGTNAIITPGEIKAK